MFRFVMIFLVFALSILFGCLLEMAVIQIKKVSDLLNEIF